MDVERKKRKKLKDSAAVEFFGGTEGGKKKSQETHPKILSGVVVRGDPAMEKAQRKDRERKKKRTRK
jgi:hypothetical protein